MFTLLTVYRNELKPLCDEAMTAILATSSKLVDDLTAKIKTAKTEHLDNGRSIVLWHKHQLVYWTVMGMYSVINPDNKLPPTSLPVIFNWRENIKVYGLSGALLMIVLLIEWIYR
jgi:hypothetical protein